MADADILLAAWERWEGDCFDRLNGCYAFAVWDHAQRTLTLARDPFAQRPLHFHRGVRFFAFASMPKGLHALEEIPRAPDESMAQDYLAFMPEHDSRSFFAGVERVEPGCRLDVTPQGVTSERHWRPTRRLLKMSGSEEYSEALRAHLDRATSAQLRGAGNPVGAHLSGGLDSSGVAATAARLRAATGEKVVGFTAVPRDGFEYDGPKWHLTDEGPLAAATAALYPNMEQVKVSMAGRTPLDRIDHDFLIYDRPIFNRCNSVWHSEISQQAKARGITVMLHGLYGNATSSYDGLDLLPSLIAQGRLRDWLRHAREVVAVGVVGPRAVVVDSLGPWTPLPVWRWANGVRRRHNHSPEEYTALKPGLRRQRQVNRRMKALGWDAYARPAADGFRTRLRILSFADSGNYNKGDLAGWGLDRRDPTLDRELVEFCLSVPPEQYLLNGMPRSLARRALSDRLPPEVTRERRMGRQGVDWFEGFTAARGEIADWIGRLEGCRPAADALDLPRLRRLMDAWPTEGWAADEVEHSYRLAMLRGLSVGHFLHRASGSNS
jgi:asparagine synthase (glutamine-hydrolysing)